MRIPYFHRLNTEEKTNYNLMILGIKFEKVDCWDLKAPDDFENHTPRDLIKHD